jgi:hypothetical protein
MAIKWDLNSHLQVSYGVPLLDTRELKFLKHLSKSYTCILKYLCLYIIFDSYPL